MKIKKIINFSNDQNTYIIKSENELALIDPGAEFKKIEEHIDCDLKYIILTHCHYDHIESLISLKEKYGSEIVFSKTGKSNLNNPNVNLSKMVYDKNTGLEPDILVSDGDILNLGKIKIKCIETPGHTSCGMCYLTEDNLFSGDTLFLGSIGRCDLPTGSYSVLENSIKNKLYTLSENIEVYPGHGDKTTIKNEKLYNSFIRG